jgi:ABC-type transport system involved in multi-copper enzyme maturation permease subunit
VLGPIFARELATVPRRKSHYATRAALVGLLLVLGITLWQAMVGFDRDAELGQTARFGQLVFQISVYVELVLAMFFAALSAASAVSQEKDRRTFILLLLTDMSDFEIVLGKLLGALLPITVLLLTGVPVFSLFLLLGGIDPSQVIQAAVVLLATAYAAGSLGGLVALWRERTFEALALSVLFLVLYLCVSQGVGFFAPAAQPWVDPWAAMNTVVYPQPDAAFAPAYGYGLVMLGLCGVVNALGVWKLRKWNPSGEPIIQREKSKADPEADMTPDELKAYRAKAHAAPGAVREVWDNPILWREIKTLAYGRRPLLIKLAFGIVLALVLYLSISTLYKPGGRPPYAAAYGLVPLAVVSMLLIAAQSSTSVTSERDGGALDVLLVTDVSPREFVFGKILGVLWNTKEYFIPPLLLAIYYGVLGIAGLNGANWGMELLARTDPDTDPGSRSGTHFISMLMVLGGLALVFAFVLVLGLHVSLRLVNSRVAIGNTLGTVFFLTVGTLIAIYLIVINGGSFGNQWLSFIGFLVLGIGGLWWVLTSGRPSPALSLAAVACPLAVFFTVTSVIIAKPGSVESGNPLPPFFALAVAFGFTVYAMLFPLVTEFDVALGRTTTPNEE